MSTTSLETITRRQQGGKYGLHAALHNYSISHPGGRDETRR